MCLICVEWEKGKLTFTEAMRNLGEMSTALEPEHVEEVKKMLIDDLRNEYEDLQDEIQDEGYDPTDDDEDEGYDPTDDTATD